MKAVVATDGSELAVDAAARGVPLLVATEVVVLTVVDAVPGDDHDPAPGTIDAVRAVLPAGLRASARTRVETGDPGPMIVWVAEHESADVIVVGSHGKGTLKRTFIGSVSDHVVRNATCPVLVIRTRDHS